MGIISGTVSASCGMMLLITAVQLKKFAVWQLGPLSNTGKPSLGLPYLRIPATFFLIVWALKSLDRVNTITIILKDNL